MPRQPRLDGSQSRARAVCIRCHSRKVRCDRESQPNGVCSRCEREGHSCRLHVGPRKEKALRSSLATPCPNVSSSIPVPDQELATPVSFNPLGQHISDEHTVDNESSSRHLPMAVEMELDLQMTQAARLPPTIIGQALGDFYFRELFSFIPVLDRDQVGPGSSLLVRQSLCLGGSLMLRSTSWPSEWSPLAIYGRVKSSVFQGTNSDPLDTLSAFCILGAWCPYAPDEIVIDNPWQWTGMAIRFALQLQLHDEKAHSQFSRPGRTRRMWWYLFNNDTMQTACGGRPGMFPLNDSNVAMPRPSDFEVVDTNALVFCEVTYVCRKLREILELTKGDAASQTDMFGYFRSLSAWRSKLPEELVLFDRTSPTATRRPYNRPLAELYIFYLVTIILTCFLGRRENSSLYKCISTVASSQISLLYEEILYHEDVPHLLAIHAWANLVAAIPRTFIDPNLQSPTRPHEMNISRMVLERMSEKHASASLVQKRIDLLGHGEENMFPEQRGDAIGEEDALLPVTDAQRAEIFALFPFPEAWCPLLERLCHAGNGNGLPSEPISGLLEGAEMDWPVHWSSFLFDLPVSF